MRFRDFFILKMTWQITLVLITFAPFRLWAGPFEIQLMSVSVTGNQLYRFIFPKFSNETEFTAVTHYFANLKSQPELATLVPIEFRHILGVGKNLNTGNIRNRILILANADYHHTNSSEDLKMIAGTLAELRKDVFALPVSAMSGLDLNDRRQFLNLLRKNFGVVIALGGADVHYSLYGRTSSPVDGPMNLQRDLDEAEVLKTFIFNRSNGNAPIQNSRGVIAICRGCQTLAVVLGYELVRDIPTQIKNPLNHQRNHLIKMVPTKMNLQHRAFEPIAKGPYEQRGFVEVYSRHHQSVKYGTQYPGRGLQIAAYASDGVAEAFETDTSFGLGPGVATQHHPEYYSNRMRKSFFSQVLGSCAFTFNIAISGR